MSKHGPKETLLRASALEIAKREGITIEAAMKAASAVDTELAEEARCERLEQPTAHEESNVGDAQLTVELMDRTQEHQRKLGLGFADAYAKACEELAHRVVYFDEAGFAKFLGELAPEYQPIARLAVLLGGPRRGDLLGLRWDDVDFDQGLVWIGNRKTANGFDVPMNGEARVLLMKLQQRVRDVQKQTDPARIIPFVFVDGEGRDYAEPKRAYVISQVFERAQKRAGVFVRRPFHTLRHTAGSWMTQAGVPLHHVSKVLGHKNLATTMRYAHLQPEHLKDAMAALDQRIAPGDRPRSEERNSK